MLRSGLLVRRWQQQQRRGLQAISQHASPTPLGCCVATAARPQPHHRPRRHMHASASPFLATYPQISPVAAQPLEPLRVRFEDPSHLPQRGGDRDGSGGGHGSSGAGGPKAPRNRKWPRRLAWGVGLGVLAVWWYSWSYRRWIAELHLPLEELMLEAEQSETCMRHFDMQMWKRGGALLNGMFLPAKGSLPPLSAHDRARLEAALAAECPLIAGRLEDLETYFSDPAVSGYRGPLPRHSRSERPDKLESLSDLFAFQESHPANPAVLERRKEEVAAAKKKLRERGWFGSVVATLSPFRDPLDAQLDERRELIRNYNSLVSLASLLATQACTLLDYPDRWGVDEDDDDDDDEGANEGEISLQARQALAREKLESCYSWSLAALQFYQNHWSSLDGCGALMAQNWSILGTAAARLPERRREGEAVVALRAALEQMEQVHQESMLNQDSQEEGGGEEGGSGGDSIGAQVAALERTMEAFHYYKSAALTWRTLADAQGADNFWVASLRARKRVLQLCDEQVRFFHAHLAPEERNMHDQPWAEEVQYTLFALAELTHISYAHLQSGRVDPATAMAAASSNPNASKAVTSTPANPAAALLAARHATRLVGVISRLYYQNPAFVPVTTAAVIRTLGAVDEADELEADLARRGIAMLHHHPVPIVSEDRVEGEGQGGGADFDQDASQQMLQSDKSAAVTDAAAMEEVRAGLSFFLHCNGLAHAVEKEDEVKAVVIVTPVPPAQAESKSSETQQSAASGSGTASPSSPSSPPTVLVAGAAPRKRFFPSPSSGFEWDFSSLEVRSDCAAAYVQLADALAANQRPASEVAAARSMAEQIASLHPDPAIMEQLEAQIAGVATAAEVIMVARKERQRLDSANNKDSK